MDNILDPTYFGFYLITGLVLIGFLIAVAVNRKGHYYDHDLYKEVYFDKSWKERVMVGLLVAAITAFPALGLTALVDSFAFNKVKVDAQWSRSIETLGDSNGAKGRFFLGSGSINSAPVYMYYLEESDGFHLYHADASQSRITYTDGTPTMVVHFKTSGNLFWSRNLGNQDDWGPYRDYEFQVPPGSIQNQYVLDAQ